MKYDSLLEFSLSIGIFGYIIFFLGVAHLLYPLIIILVTVFYLLFLFVHFWSRVKMYVKTNSLFSLNSSYLLLIPLILIWGINLIGALGPELAFDALWYHLTLPKLYLLDHFIHVIDGGLLYYSGMPQLGEMYYLVALVLQGEVLAKVIHYAFGLLCCLTLYALSRRAFSFWLSLLILIIFSSNLVVSWESTTAYIDLIRAFFEIAALSSLFVWYDTKKSKYLLSSGILLGMEVGVKLLALGSYPLFALGVLFLSSQSTWKAKRRELVKFTLCFVLPIVPWVLFSLSQTGNPVYPFFTSLYDTGLRSGFFNPFVFIKSIFSLFTSASDPVSPLYLIVLPLLLFVLRKRTKGEMFLLLYCVLALFVWYLTPDTGGGRFIVPYLPAFSLLVGLVIKLYMQKEKKISYILIILALLISVVTICYRGVANARYLSVILRQESKGVFLTNHLNFSFGDFYDTDGYLEKTITLKHKALLIGFHNLYYVNFPFIDQTYTSSSDRFDYILTQHSELPSQFSSWKEVYYNKITDVTLYTK